MNQLLIGCSLGTKSGATANDLKEKKKKKTRLYKMGVSIFTDEETEGHLEKLGLKVMALFWLSECMK